jgi:hypothetical protein
MCETGTFQQVARLHFGWMMMMMMMMMIFGDEHKSWSCF